MSSSNLSMLSRKLDDLLSQPALLIGGSMAAEILLVLHCLSSGASMTEMVLFHGIISAFVIAGSLPWLRRSEPNPGIALYVASLIALGPIGVLGCVLMAAVRWISSRSSVSFEEWYERLSPQAFTDRAQALYELIEWRSAKPSRESTVAPFCDVLDQGSVAQKQSVVMLIADHFKPEFSPALQRALNDPEPAIRVQAATAAARIENHFLQQSIVLQEERTKNPSNPSVMRRIALHHESYARTGLLDAERVASERTIALEINMKLLKASPHDPELVATVARLLLELDRPGLAMRLLIPWLRAKSIPHPLVGPIAEALYSLKRLRLLRRLSARLLASLTASVEDEPIRTSLRMWTPAHA
jgi:polysaccharide biosynthesis protein PelE